MCWANVKGLWADGHCWHVLMFLCFVFCFISLYIFLIFPILVADVLWGSYRTILYKQNAMFYLGCFSKILKTVIFLGVSSLIHLCRLLRFVCELVLVFCPECRRTPRGGAGPPPRCFAGLRQSRRMEMFIRRAAACSLLLTARNSDHDGSARRTAAVRWARGYPAMSRSRSVRDMRAAWVLAVSVCVSVQTAGFPLALHPEVLLSVLGFKQRRPA